MRGRSREARLGKTWAIMDANAAAIKAALLAHDCRRLIHGHTHRPGREDIQLGSGTAERWVLSDWDTGRGDALELNRIIALKMLLNAHSTGVMAKMGRVVGNTMTAVQPGIFGAGTNAMSFGSVNFDSISGRSVVSPAPGVMFAVKLMSTGFFTSL